MFGAHQLNEIFQELTESKVMYVLVLTRSYPQFLIS